MPILLPQCWTGQGGGGAVIFSKDRLKMLISLLIFHTWSPLLSISLVLGIIWHYECVFLRWGFVIFKTVSGDLCLHLLWSCCNCSFGAMSLACSPSPPLPLSAIPHDLSLFCPSMSSIPARLISEPHLPSLRILLIDVIRRHRTPCCPDGLFAIDCNATFKIVFCWGMETIMLWLFSAFHNALCAQSPVFPLKLDLQSHSCLGWKLNTGLVFSMLAPLPFIQYPQHACSQARGFTLRDNGCVQLQGISSRVLS